MKVPSASLSIIQCDGGGLRLPGRGGISGRSAFRRRLGAAEGAVEPAAGEGPVAVGGARRKGKDLGRLFDGQAREAAQLDESGRLFVVTGQRGQGLVEGEQMIDGDVD